MMPKKYNTNSFENIFQVSFMYLKHNNSKVKGKKLDGISKNPFRSQMPRFY